MKHKRPAQGFLAGRLIRSMIIELEFSLTTFFTADTHLGHEGIIRHCYRRFDSVEAMDNEIINRWNAVVGKGDTVWHLGDFTLAGAEAAEAYAARLNGKINLIWGNHDRNAVRKLNRWVSSQYAVEINLDGDSLTLCHYGMRVWNKCHHGSLMLFGHSHGNLTGTSQSLDVGVDAWDFRPITLAEIKSRMLTLPAFRSEDHHLPA